MYDKRIDARMTRDPPFSVRIRSIITLLQESTFIVAVVSLFKSV